MPEPLGTFAEEVDNQLAALAEEIVALRDQQQALTPRIFTLERQQKALQAYRQTVNLNPPPEPPHSPGWMQLEAWADAHPPAATTAVPPRHQAVQ